MRLDFTYADMEAFYKTTLLKLNSDAGKFQPTQSAVEDFAKFLGHPQENEK